MFNLTFASGSSCKTTRDNQTPLAVQLTVRQVHITDHRLATQEAQLLPRWADRTAYIRRLASDLR